MKIEDNKYESHVVAMNKISGVNLSIEDIKGKERCKLQACQVRESLVCPSWIAGDWCLWALAISDKDWKILVHENREQ